MATGPLGQVPGPYEDTTCQMVAAYGRSDHPHLEVVREFRDKILESTATGEKLVGYYYATAPFFVSLAERSSLMQSLFLYGFAYPSYMVSRGFLALLD